MISDAIKKRIKPFSIGLCASIPSPNSWICESQDRAIMHFVALFAEMVFRSGGQIIQVFHPLFTPIIIRQAEECEIAQGSRQFRLFISEPVANATNRKKIQQYGSVADIEIMKTRPKDALSLDQQYECLLFESNTLVVVGLESQKSKDYGTLGHAFQEALKRHIPCFWTGVPDEFADHFLAEQKVDTQANSRMSLQEFKKLANNRDIVGRAPRIFYHLVDNVELARQRTKEQKKNAIEVVSLARFLPKPEPVEPLAYAAASVTEWSAPGKASVQSYSHSTNTIATPVRKERTGEVLASKMQKTIVVRVERRVPHPKFKKIVRIHKKFYAHDEKNEAKPGDRVLIRETRPMSKLKRWELVSVLKH